MPRAMAALWKMSTSPFTVTGKHRNKKEDRILSFCVFVGHFWLVPFLIPYLGGVIGVIVYQVSLININKQQPQRYAFKLLGSLDDVEI